MVDLQNLKLVEEDITVADDAQYVDASAFAPPIPEGVYTFSQGKPTFKATGKGFLQAEMTQTVAGGEQDGKTLSFDRISDKPFERSGVRVNMMKDQLRAIGDHATYRTHQEYATALEAAEGKPFFSPTIAGILVGDYMRQLQQRGLQDSYDLLTEREKETLQLLAEGKSNKEVARILNLSVYTVETHRSNIMEKLDLHTTADIILYAVRKKLITA
jgi:DNA-binding CsgD family transcriptional regulator